MAQRPVLNQFRLGKTKTGSKTAKDHGLQSFAVFCSLRTKASWSQSQSMLLGAQRLDWTGPSNTNEEWEAELNDSFNPGTTEI